MARFKSTFAEGLTDHQKSQNAKQLDALAVNSTITKDGQTNRSFVQQLRLVLQDGFPRKKYTVQPGDTAEIIAAAAGISVDVLYYLNPQLGGSDPLADDVILLPYTSPIGTFSDEDISLQTIRFNSVFADDTKTTENISGDNQQTTVTGGTNSTVQNTVTGTSNSTATVTSSSVNTETDNSTTNNTENNSTTTASVTVTDATATNSNPEQTQLQPPLPADRSDIKIWTELTATQKTTYHWDEVLLQFKAAQPKVSSYELKAWTRKQLRDGWNFGDAVPLLYEARQVASLGGIPVIEAYYFNDAWNFAEDLGLPKNADAPFYWQTKFAGTRRLFRLNYSSNEQWQNYVNNHTHLDTVSYDLLLEAAGNTNEDIVLYNKIKSIPHPNDQLLSMEFLLLTSHAQRTVYTALNDPKVDEKCTGIYSPAFYTELTAWKNTKTAAIQKEEADNKLMQWSGLPDAANPGYSFYKRDNVQFSLNQSKLAELRQKINSCPGTVSYDALESYVTENFPVPTEGHENEKYFKVLSHVPRTTLLEAFMNEWWLDNSQELIVNGIIRSTPMELMQREQLNTWLRKQQNERYETLKGMVNESTTNQRSFFDATEIVSVTKPGMAPTYDQLFIDKAQTPGLFRTPWENIERMGLMSKGMIESLTYAQFKDMMYNIEDYEDYKEEDDDNEVPVPDAEFDKLDFFIITWSQKNPGQAGEYFSANSFSEMLRLKKNMDESVFNRVRDEAFEAAFGSNPIVYSNIVPIIYKPPYETFEDITSGMPGSLIRDLSQYEQMEIIYQLMNNFGVVGGESELTINRIFQNVGYKNFVEGKEQPTVEKIEADRKSFYTNLTSDTWKLTEDRFYSSFSGYQESLAIQQLRDMQNMPASTQTQSVTNAGYFGKDEAINEMTPAAMRTLTFQQREEYIRILLGKTMAEEPYNALFARFNFFAPALALAAPQNWTRVGESDEESLLLLMKTCPANEYDDLMDLIKKDGGNVYYALDAAIHGEQYKRMHDEVAVITEDMTMGEQYERDAAGNILIGINGVPIETESYKKNKAEREQMQTDMDRQGLSHPKVVPWSDPGLLKQLFAGATVFEYHLSFTAENKIRVQYNISNAWALTIPALAGLIGTATSNTKEFDAEERIGVLFLSDDLALNANRGEVRMMPAINLFYLENKQTNRQIGEAIDVAVVAISIVTLMTPAAPLFEVVLAIGDLAYSLLHLITESFKENLPEDVRESLAEIEGALMTAQLIGGGIMAAKLLRAAATKLLAKLAGTKLSQDVVTVLKGRIAQAESEAKLLEQLETATKVELEGFLADLERMGAKADDGFAAFYKARLKEQIARATGDQRLILQATKEREALALTNNSGHSLQGGHVGPITTSNGSSITRNRYNGIDVTVPGANGKPQRMQVNIENGEMHFVPVDPADASALKYVDDELRWKTYENMTANDQALVKNKPKPPVTQVEPVAPKAQTYDDVINTLATKTEVTADEVEALIAGLNREHNVIASTGKATDDMLDAAGANALYWPGGGGKPGIMLIRTGAKPEELIEEMMHLMQHEKTGWKRLSVSDILRLEVQAHDDLLRYAEENNWSAEQKARLKQNRDYWNKQQKGYSYDPTVKATMDAQVGAMTSRKIVSADDIINGLPATWSNELKTALRADLEKFPELFENIPDKNAAADAWKVLHNAGRTEMKTNPVYIQKISLVLRNPGLAKIGIGEVEIERMLKNMTDDSKSAGKKIEGMPYKNLAEKLEQEIFDDLFSFGVFIENNPGVKFVNFENMLSKLTGPQFSNRKAASWMMRDIASDSKTFGGKTIEIEFGVKKAGGGQGFIDIKINDVPPKFIEYKAGPNSLEKKHILEEFIERDLNVANDLQQVEWRITENAFNQATLITWLKSSEAANSFAKLSKEKVAALLNNNDLLQASKQEIADAFVEYFEKSDNFNMIFKTK